MLVTLETALYSPCLSGYATIGLARHNRMHINQSERLLVKPKRSCTDLCAEPVGVWNRLGLSYVGSGDCLDIMAMPPYHYRNPNYKDKTVSWPSYLHNGNPYPSKDGLYIETRPCVWSVLPLAILQYHINSLGPSDAIWPWRSWSTLACCLTAPSHYLNQCWLIMSKVQWHSSV